MSQETLAGWQCRCGAMNALESAATEDEQCHGCQAPRSTGQVRVLYSHTALGPEARAPAIASLASAPPAAGVTGHYDHVVSRSVLERLSRTSRGLRPVCCVGWCFLIAWLGGYLLPLVVGFLSAVLLVTGYWKSEAFGSPLGVVVASALVQTGALVAGVIAGAIVGWRFGRWWAEILVAWTDWARQMLVAQDALLRRAE